MQDRFRDLVLGVALALMVGWLLYISRSIVIPIVAAIIIAYILVGVAGRLERIPVVGPRLPGWARQTIAIVAVVGVIGLFSWMVSANLEQVLARAPTYQETLLAFVTDLVLRFGMETQPTWDFVRREMLGQVDLQAVIRTMVSAVSSLLGAFFVVFIYVGFLLAERRQFNRKLRMLSSDPKDTETILFIVDDINERVGNFLATKTLINLMLGAISYVVMLILGIDFAGFFAVLIAVFNYVPYIGSMIGVTFPVMLAIVQFGNLQMALFTLIGLSAAQIFIGNFVEPRLLARSLNLSAFVILVSLTVWYSLWGITGALLSVPITAILVTTLSEFRGTRPIAILLSSDGNIDRQPRA